MSNYITYAGYTLASPKTAPQKALDNRQVERAQGGGMLIYDSPSKLVSYTYSFDPVTSAERATLLTAYLLGRTGLQSFVPLEGGGPYYAYTDNWNCEYITRTSTTYLFKVNFTITADLNYTP